MWNELGVHLPRLGVLLKQRNSDGAPAGAGSGYQHSRPIPAASGANRPSFARCCCPSIVGRHIAACNSASEHAHEAASAYAPALTRTYVCYPCCRACMRPACPPVALPRQAPCLASPAAAWHQQLTAPWPRTGRTWRARPPAASAGRPMHGEQAYQRQPMSRPCGWMMDS